MLITQDPFTALESLRREMTNLMGAYAPPFLQRSHGFPAVNLWEDASALYAEAEVPGLSLKDIEVTVEGDQLTVKGHRETLDAREYTYHRRERGTGEFARTLALPVEINPDQVEATLTDGVLRIRLPKAETAKARKIKVTAS
ncbi:MAG TPA: Hsp20/alpha crystallin family protein [Phycisphaerae bacterium]|nr:Hsp20/alpha crystallin family protein [Phycisphaerae bacterium]